MTSQASMHVGCKTCGLKIRKIAPHCDRCGSSNDKAPPKRVIGNCSNNKGLKSGYPTRETAINRMRSFPCHACGKCSSCEEVVSALGVDLKQPIVVFRPDADSLEQVSKDYRNKKVAWRSHNESDYLDNKVLLYNVGDYANIPNYDTQIKLRLLDIYNKNYLSRSEKIYAQDVVLKLNKTLERNRSVASAPHSDRKGEEKEIALITTVSLFRSNTQPWLIETFEKHTLYTLDLSSSGKFPSLAKAEHLTEGTGSLSVSFRPLLDSVENTVVLSIKKESYDPKNTMYITRALGYDGVMIGLLFDKSTSDLQEILISIGNRIHLTQQEANRTSRDESYVRPVAKSQRQQRRKQQQQQQQMMQQQRMQQQQMMQQQQQQQQRMMQQRQRQQSSEKDVSKNDYSGLPDLVNSDVGDSLVGPSMPANWNTPDLDTGTMTLDVFRTWVKLHATSNLPEWRTKEITNFMKLLIHPSEKSLDGLKYGEEMKVSAIAYNEKETVLDRWHLGVYPYKMKNVTLPDSLFSKVPNGKMDTYQCTYFLITNDAEAAEKAEDLDKRPTISTVFAKREEVRKGEKDSKESIFTKRLNLIPGDTIYSGRINDLFSTSELYMKLSDERNILNISLPDANAYFDKKWKEADFKDPKHGVETLKKMNLYWKELKQLDEDHLIFYTSTANEGAIFFVYMKNPNQNATGEFFLTHITECIPTSRLKKPNSYRPNTNTNTKKNKKDMFNGPYDITRPYEPSADLYRKPSQATAKKPSFPPSSVDGKDEGKKTGKGPLPRDPNAKQQQYDWTLVDPFRSRR